MREIHLGIRIRLDIFRLRMLLPIVSEQTLYKTRVDALCIGLDILFFFFYLLFYSLIPCIFTYYSLGKFDYSSQKSIIPQP